MQAPHTSGSRCCCFQGRSSSSRSAIAKSSRHTAHGQHVQALLQPVSHVQVLPNTSDRLSNICSSSRRSRGLLTITHAQRGPDRGSVAALEAALAAINKILGTYNRVRQPSGSKSSKQGSSSSAGSGGAAAGAKAGIAGMAASGPSKLISFGAKASSSAPVKVC
jgi:hypothetical protein